MDHAFLKKLLRVVNKFYLQRKFWILTKFPREHTGSRRTLCSNHCESAGINVSQ